MVRARSPRALLLALLLPLAACGFHLQGHTPLPTLVKTPYVEAPDRQTDFVQSLRHALLSDGAQLVPDRTAASAVISVQQDQMTRRVVSVSAANEPDQYELTYVVRVSVTAGGKEVLPVQELSATRTYSFTEPLLLAKGHEEDILRQDMARDLAERVMRLLSQL